MRVFSIELQVRGRGIELQPYWKEVKRLTYSGYPNDEIPKEAVGSYQNFVRNNADCTYRLTEVLIEPNLPEPEETTVE